jgi:aminodeoxyfutalosine deaminase
MIVRAPVIVTMNGRPIADGAVRIENDRIAAVGRRSHVGSANEQLIDLHGCALLPGLINAHCHLDYTCLRGQIPSQNSFAGWILAINAEKAKLSAEDYLQSIEHGLAQAQRFGTTALVNLEAFPELIDRCSVRAARTWWCAELIDVIAPDKTDEIVSAAAERRRKIENGGFGFAPHALFTASATLYQRCNEIASAEDLLLTTHLAESREEMEMFRDAAGPVFELLRSLGRDDSDCGRSTPLQRFLEIISDSSTSLRFAQNDKNGAGRWLIAHLNELTKGDFDLLAGLPKKFSIAHCPRSHGYFRHSPFAFERLNELGFNVCLATDSLASNADLSLFSEMRLFHETYAGVPAEDILKMVTVNPAKALGRSAELGKLAPGFLADLIALPIDGSIDIYEEIIAFDGEVPWMMIGGEVQ